MYICIDRQVGMSEDLLSLIMMYWKYNKIRILIVIVSLVAYT